MSSRCRNAFARVIGAWVAVTAVCAAALGNEPLRVCADPDNLPYSDRAERGFENRIAQVLADELDRPLVYFWHAQQRGYVRKTLGANLCDVLIGVPVEFDRVLTTRPYYRAGYVFVTRAGVKAIAGFDDPRLRTGKVGVQLVGDDLAATPPSHALAAAGVVESVVGYPLIGDTPAAQRIIEAIDRGEIASAVIWGPQAGYFAARAKHPLQWSPATPPAQLAPLAFEFSIAMGVRKGDRELRDGIDRALVRRRGAIDAILAEFSVPRTDR